ncbi:MAG TPA: hypothetical protein VGS19_03695 [Streptosporangiaceae bacterium]|nr:hypothetical protein [Streptosporangiaceae bacterium]
MRLLADSVANQAVPGILGFLVVAGMGLALYFLLRSMNKQLRKVSGDPKWRDEVTKATTVQPGGDEDARPGGTPEP